MCDDFSKVFDKKVEQNAITSFLCCFNFISLTLRNLDEFFALEVNVDQYRQNHREEYCEHKSPHPRLHSVGHIHAIEACDARWHHQDDGDDCEGAHYHVHVIAND